MLATMQRMLHKLTRSRRGPAQAKVIAKVVGMRWRYVWAQAVQQLVDSASRSASAARFPTRHGKLPCRCPPRWSRPVAPSCWQARKHSWTVGDPSQLPPCSSARRS